mmetsp:Transcript_6474/g.24362  ORF Transcript_6474/g.24362 Transcript_6474/m.24362 type:complete len:115 (+) Transcript_6474:676-1020(+)
MFHFTLLLFEWIASCLSPDSTTIVESYPILGVEKEAQYLWNSTISNSHIPLSRGIHYTTPPAQPSLPPLLVSVQPHDASIVQSSPLVRLESLHTVQDASFPQKQQKTLQYLQYL